MHGIFVLQKTDAPKAGHYVARSGSKHSYTPDISNAQWFLGSDTAERHRCGNERALPLDEAMGAFR